MAESIKIALWCGALLLLDVLIWHFMQFAVIPLPLLVTLGAIAIFWNAVCAHQIVEAKGLGKQCITWIAAVAFIWVVTGTFFEWREAVLTLFTSGLLQSLLVGVSLVAMCGWLYLSLKKKDELCDQISKLSFEKLKDGILSGCHTLTIFGLVCILIAGLGYSTVSFTGALFCFGLLGFMGLWMIFRNVGLPLLMIHVAAEGGTAAKGLFSQTGSYIFAMLVWSVAAFCEFVIDCPSIYGNTKPHNDDKLKENESSVERVSLLNPTITVLLSGAYGVCVVLLGIYLWPQFMLLLASTFHIIPVALSINGLGWMGFSIICVALTLGGCGAACFVYQNLRAPAQHDHEGSFIRGTTLSSWFVCVVTCCTCVLTGVLGALLFSNLMGFSAYTTFLNVIAAGYTDFSVYHGEIGKSVVASGEFLQSCFMGDNTSTSSVNPPDPPTPRL